MSIYYVYAYLRNSDNTPYYIGKGKDKRAFSNRHNVSVPKDKSKIVFLETNLTDLGACAIERRMIRWYGRKDNGTGILYNRTDGGDGNCGRIVPDAERKQRSILTKKRFESPEERMKLSERMKGSNNPNFGKKQDTFDRSNYRKPKSEEHKLSMIGNQRATGKPKSEEHKRKLSESNKGKKKPPLSKETKEIMSKQRKGRKWYNDGMDCYFIHPECALDNYVLGRL